MNQATQRDFAQTRLLRLCVAAVIAIVLSTVELYSQEATRTSTENVSGEGGAADRSIPSLLPAGALLLADALAKERGPVLLGAVVSFPLPVCAFAGGLCGAVDRDGNIVVTPEFDWVDNFHEGRALVRLAGHYGYVDDTGHVIVEPRYDLAGEFSHDVAQIDVDGRSGLIDRDGRTVLDARFGYIQPFTENTFWATEERGASDGPPGLEQFSRKRPILHDSGPRLVRNIFPVGKWGLLDRSGAWIKPPQFLSVSPFDGKDFMWAQADAGWGLVRPDGIWEVEPRFLGVWPLIDGLAYVTLPDHSFAAVDASGRIVTDIFATEMLRPRQLGKSVGLIDRSGAWVAEPRYDSIVSARYFTQYTRIPPTWWETKIGKKVGLLDDTGREVAAPQFDIAPKICADGSMAGVASNRPRMLTRDGQLIEPPQGELWWPDTCLPLHVVKVGDKFGYADAALRPITPPKFEDAKGFVNGLAVAKFEGKFGLLRPDGSWAIDPNFEAMALLPPKAGVALAASDGKSGVIDTLRHGWIAPPRFDAVCSIRSGMIMAIADGNRGVMDATGAWLIHPNFTRLGLLLGDGLVPAQLDGKWALIDTGGMIVVEPKFDEPTFFSRGINWTKSGPSWCPIDRRGRQIPGLQCQGSDPMQRDFSRIFDCSIH